MANINVNYSPYRNDFRTQKIAAGNKIAVLKNSDEIIKIDISPVFMILVLLAIMVLLSGLYLLNFNKVATMGYQLKRLQISRQELKDQSDLQTLYLAKVKSMNNMMATGTMDKMRKPNKVEFVFGENIIAQAN